MNLDDAIQQIRVEAARIAWKDWGRAERQEQVAKWLEELKRRRLEAKKGTRKDAYVRIEAARRRQRKHILWWFIKAVGVGIGGMVAWMGLCALMAIIS